MTKTSKVAIIGLDTSHAVEFPKLMQDPAVPAENRVPELKTTRCLRFETPFQNREGLNKRTQYLESIGVQVTEDFDTAVADCDAILIEINDPSLHLKYFERCAALGKPVFLDKPFADTFENAMKIMEIAETHGTRFFTSSALRFDFDFAAGLAEKTEPEAVTIWGPVGKAPAGSSLVWYGVHAFEMLQRAMGRGAITVRACGDRRGYVCHVVYADGRRGVVELTENVYRYGALIRDHKSKEQLIPLTGKVPFYAMLLREIVRFLDGAQPVELADSLEVMAMLSAADRSIVTGCAEPVYTR